jgi:hypothetical protein
MSDNSKYFVLEESEKKASVLLKRAQSWTDSLISNNYLNKCRASWMAYYGAQRGEGSDSHKISFGGDQGELAFISVNHYRNIASHIINMTVSSRPAMEAQAVNTDSKTQAQTILANGLLDYYMFQKRLEAHFRKAVESAVVLGEGYIRIGWNDREGDAYFADETTGKMLYTGDLEFVNLTPFDVIRDTSREDDKNDWILIRTYKNKYDLAAKYPDLKDKILACESKDYARNAIKNVFNEETDLISVWEFYHKRTEAVPNGNYLAFVSSEAILYDGALPYREIPVYRISVDDILGTPLGYTPMFDLLPIQENVNGLYSTVLTNQTAFGVQNILLPKGADISEQSLGGGLNIIYYDKDEGKPESLNLTNTPVEIFKTIEMMVKEMETISGVNSVVRGNPEASLRSGNSLALVQAQAVAFSSSLQQSYIRLIEDTGTGIIQILQDYADEPRIAFISGKSNKTYLKEFKGSDLSNVNRVIVRAANPLSKTIGGRLEIAQNLVQMGLIKNPEDYLTVLSTGKLEPMYEGDQAQLILIKKENEMLMDGKLPPIVETDWHATHINEHQAVLADPEIRQNPQIREAILAHMRAHLDMLKYGDPEMLMMLGQQPLGQGGMPPGAPGQPPQGGPAGAPPAPGNADANSTIPQVEGSPAPEVLQEAADIKLPQPPPIPPSPAQIAGDELL